MLIVNNHDTIIIVTSVSLPPSLFSPLSPESKREGRRKRYNYIEKKRDNFIVEASSLLTMMVLMMNPLVWLVSSDDNGPYVESPCLASVF